MTVSHEHADDIKTAQIEIQLKIMHVSPVYNVTYDFISLVYLYC
jgi:hypothetical protein